MLRLACENLRWDPRIVGELNGLGITVSATTVRTRLRAAGLGPAGKRRETTWREGVRAHRQSLLAVDFFTSTTIWLQRLYVLSSSSWAAAVRMWPAAPRVRTRHGSFNGAAAVVDLCADNVSNMADRATGPSSTNVALIATVREREATAVVPEHIVSVVVGE